MKRWICPTCGGGVHAPERPRKNDVRRYCLDCSKDAGVLVERSAPALERRRAAAALRSAGKQKVKRERARAASLTKLTNARGETVMMDIPATVWRAMREMGYTGKASDVQVDVRKRTDGFTSGRAFPWEDRVVLSVGGSYESALEVCYHEAAHLCAKRNARDPKGRQYHGEEFQRCLSDALQKRWPFLTWGSVRTGGSYQKDRSVESQLWEHVKNGGEL